MKRFLIKTSIIITTILMVFALNVIYLVTLYRSIEKDVRRDVHSAMIDMDVDELWLRTLNSVSKGDAYTLYMVDVANFNRDSLEQLNNRVEGRLIDTKNANGNQVLKEMSRQMHSDLDIRSNVNLALNDSLLSEHLAVRNIHPAFVGVEICDTLGNVLVHNPGIKADLNSYDIFELPVNGFVYRAYISPLTSQIFNKMQGVIITSFILIVLFAIGFWYLLNTIRKMRTIEDMKDDFVNNMTHELKTPIAVAYAANDSLLNFNTANDAEKRKAYLGIAQKQLRKLQELVESILSISMERRKSIKLNIENIDLLPLVHEIVETQQLRKEKLVRISVSGPTNIPVTVKVDRTHFANVLNTIIDNAIKYSGDSVDIEIECLKDRIKISDNGIGIPSKSLPYIFDRFYRVPHGNIQDVHGYGIGLYYARQMLDKMGCSIKAESKVGHGTIFTIIFSEDEK